MKNIILIHNLFQGSKLGTFLVLPSTVLKHSLCSINTKIITPFPIVSGTSIPLNYLS